ncbi:MAG: hypothetical protein GY782_01125 [Gammaproteobacteria bacterium]|nr:hypothetical protein [Gammaproteobacteria bacterium]
MFSVSIHLAVCDWIPIQWFSAQPLCQDVMADVRATVSEQMPNWKIEYLHIREKEFVVWANKTCQGVVIIKEVDVSIDDG